MLLQAVLSSFMGTAPWGVGFWLPVEGAGLSLALAGLLFLLIVWGTELVELPLLRIAPPSWQWGARRCSSTCGTTSSTRPLPWGRGC
jgi:hypothetical protein